MKVGILVRFVDTKDGPGCARARGLSRVNSGSVSEQPWCPAVRRFTSHWNVGVHNRINMHSLDSIVSRMRDSISEAVDNCVSEFRVCLTYGYVDLLEVRSSGWWHGSPMFCCSKESSD